MAIKTAGTDLPINNLIAERWSPRAFSEKDVESHKLRTIFEAGRWAASSGNEQPWRFIIGRKGSEIGQQLFDCLDEGNKEWNVRVPILCLAVAKKKFSFKDALNRHAEYDVGQSVAFMALQAVELGLQIHQMAGFSVEKSQKALGIDDEFEPLTMFCIGYVGVPEILNEKNHKTETSPRVRREISEICFGNWKESFDF